jgi:hypothetical protein
VNHPCDRREFLTTAARTGTTLIASAAILKETSTFAEESASAAIRVCDDDAQADLSTLQPLLILDRESVADADRVTFHLNPAKKHPENPLMLPGEPQQWDSLQVIWPGTVLYDAEDKLFRCWYSGLDAVQENRPKVPWVPGYAESEDGINWTKPDLGQYKHNDLPTNRIQVDWSQQVLSIVVRNPDQSDPARRFLALWHVDNETGQRKILASSPDGKAWKEEGTSFAPENGNRLKFIDVSSLIFQPDAANENERVLAYGQVFHPRTWDNKVVRQIGLATGPNLGSFKWLDDLIVLPPEEGVDEEIHFATVSKIGDLFVMLYESDRFSRKPLHGDLRMAVSSDGRKFRRVHSRTPLVSTGPKGMWDENLLAVTTQAMQHIGDETRIYYFGCPNVYRNWPGGYTVKGLKGSLFYPSYLGLATVPRDRFAYAAGPGSITTSELSIRDQGLWINADGNDLAISCHAADGAMLATGRVVDSVRCTGYRKVQWAGDAPRQPCQVRIMLSKDHRVYSVKS